MTTMTPVMPVIQGSPHRCAAIRGRADAALVPDGARHAAMTPADRRPENRSGHSAVYRYESNASEGADVGTATYDVIAIGAGQPARYWPDA